MKREYKFTPWWVTGFSQADGSFMILIRKKKDCKVGYQVQAVFTLSQHISDINMMEALQKYLGVGQLKLDQGKSVVVLQVSILSELVNVIIPLFDKYPLKGRKTYFLSYFSYCCHGYKRWNSSNS